MKGSTSVLGIDVGSISLSLAELSTAGEIIQTSCLFHSGRIVDTLLEALEGYATNTSAP